MNQRVLVTAGASGIGREIARAFAGLVSRGLEEVSSLATCHYYVVTRGVPRRIGTPGKATRIEQKNKHLRICQPLPQGGYLKTSCWRVFLY